MEQPAKENGLLGVEIMTAWASNKNDLDFMVQHVNGILAAEGSAGASRALSGVITVAGCLLNGLSEATGENDEALLQRLAQRFIN